MKERIRAIVESRVFNLIVQVLIVASVITIVVESELTSHREWGAVYEIIQLLDYLFVGLFAIEYLLRVYTAPRRLAYIFSFYGLIDLIAILPSILVAILPPNLGNLRALRLIRLLRIFKLLRAKPLVLATNRLKESFNEIKYEFGVFSLIAFIFMFFVACLIHHFEMAAQPEAFGTIAKSMWWSIITLTTIGYGDVYPITVGGKVVAGIIGFIGIAIIAIPSGLLASSLTKDRDEQTTCSCDFCAGDAPPQAQNINNIKAL